MTIVDVHQMIHVFQLLHFFLEASNFFCHRRANFSLVSIVRCPDNHLRADISPPDRVALNLLIFPPLLLRSSFITNHFWLLCSFFSCFFFVGLESVFVKKWRRRWERTPSACVFSRLMMSIEQTKNPPDDICHGYRNFRRRGESREIVIFDLEIKLVNFVTDYFISKLYLGLVMTNTQF